MAYSLASYREELCIMCQMFVKGSTLYAVSVKCKKQINTVRARRSMLLRLNVQMKKELLPGRGYGIPVYTLSEPLEDAVAKIDKKIADDKKKQREKRKGKTVETDKNLKKSASRFAGYGIEGWLFIDPQRAQAYIDWCDSWTDQKQKTFKGEKRGRKSKQ